MQKQPLTHTTYPNPILYQLQSKTSNLYPDLYQRCPQNYLYSQTYQLPQKLQQILTKLHDNIEQNNNQNTIQQKLLTRYKQQCEDISDNVMSMEENMQKYIKFCIENYNRLYDKYTNILTITTQLQKYIIQKTQQNHHLHTKNQQLQQQIQQNQKQSLSIQQKYYHLQMQYNRIKKMYGVVVMDWQRQKQDRKQDIEELMNGILNSEKIGRDEVEKLGNVVGILEKQVEGSERKICQLQVERETYKQQIQQYKNHIKWLQNQIISLQTQLKTQIPVQNQIKNNKNLANISDLYTKNHLKTNKNHRRSYTKLSLHNIDNKLKIQQIDTENPKNIQNIKQDPIIQIYKNLKQNDKIIQCKKEQTNIKQQKKQNSKKIVSKIRKLSTNFQQTQKQKIIQLNLELANNRNSCTTDRKDQQQYQINNRLQIKNQNQNNNSNKNKISIFMENNIQQLFTLQQNYILNNNNNEQSQSIQQNQQYNNETYNINIFPTQNNQQEKQKQKQKQKYQYDVKSIQRFSQVSSVWRYKSDTLLKYLQENAVSKIEKKCMKSIGIMTQFNQQQKYMYNNQKQSPYKLSRSPSNKFALNSYSQSEIAIQNQPTSQSLCRSPKQLNNFLSKFVYNSQSNLKQYKNKQKNVTFCDVPTIKYKQHKQKQKNQSVNENMACKISNMLTKIVTNRTHKKKTKQCIQQVQKRRQILQQNRSKLSKSFIGALQSLKQSFKVKQQILKYSKYKNSVSMIHLPKTNQNLNNSCIQIQIPKNAMKKQQNNKTITLPASANTSNNNKNNNSILNSIYDIAVKKRIKKC